MQLDACPPVNYVKRRGQRSIRIRVKPDEIIVSGPARVADRQLVGFLRDREEWVRKTVLKLSSLRSERTKKLAEMEGHVLLRGEWIPMVVRPSRPDSTTWLLVDRKDRVDAYPPDNSTDGNYNSTTGRENVSISQKTSLSTQLRMFEENVECKELHEHKQAKEYHFDGGFQPRDALSRAAYPDKQTQDMFLKELARQQLPIEFEILSQKLGFKWERLFIRSQKTKWGTCSSKGNISLNWRLIKCPQHIREYIMIHELCHTVHLNHSKEFWDLVRAHYPEVDVAHKWLKQEGELAFL
ncbi:MAG: M48 family metallopeptidase [Balneolales bacterium]|nr:M48 family metallopeptidase [Balneolales bacterium]